MAAGSGLAATIAADAVPNLPEVLDLAVVGIVPSGTRRNLESLADRLSWDPAIEEPLRLVLGDAQTSGGLLIAVDPAAVAGLLAGLERRGVRGFVIGSLATGIPGAISVRKA
jgi:selenide,water dikinase